MDANTSTQVVRSAEPSGVARKRARPIERLRQAAFRLTALSLAVVVALVVCEFGLRVGGYSPTYVNAMGSFHQADEVCGHRGRPNFSARFHNPEFDVQVAHDNHGFRRQDFQRPDDNPRGRVFAFGDSFTWGWGVDQGEVYTDQLSLLLDDWRIENFGVNGAGTVAEYELFASECRDRLQAGDVVLVMFFQNDFLDNVTGSRHAELQDGEVVLLPANSYLRPSWKRTCQQKSYLFNYLSFVANRFQMERKLRQANAQPNVSGLAGAAQSAAGIRTAASPEAKMLKSKEPGSFVGSEAQIAVTRYFLSKWKQDCEDRGARLIIAYIPGMVELGEYPGVRVASNEQDFRAAFFDSAESLEIETLDLLPGMLSAKRKRDLGPLAFARDTHWNSTGHHVVAEIIAQRLDDDKIADGR